MRYIDSRYRHLQQFKVMMGIDQLTCPSKLVHEKRQAKNAVVQMLEADVFKITLLKLHRAFQADNLPVKMVLLLHDGIWFTCPNERVTVTRVNEAIQKIMENSVRLSVPLKVGLS